ncbi:putative ribonuclease H-like domain-containing protein, partial [Tanacetum coccineum]
AGDSKKEDESAQDCFVLPIWPSYSSTISPDLKTDEKREGLREEEQVFLDELERLKRQEKEANEEAEALRKEFAQETENLVIKEGAAKASSTNLVNTISIPVSTASPHEGLYLSDPTNPEQDDSEIHLLDDIYQHSSDGIFTNSSYDDEGAVADFTNLENVVNGHRQEEGIDYDEVFAHVARIEAIRIFLAFASYMGFIVYQMDVKSAFLYGKIDEEVYVSQPPGFLDSKHPQKVYKVVKALYGLHQAPRAWYATLSTFLLKNGYRRGTIDKTLFLKKDKNDIILVQVYVDDIIFGSTKKSWCDEFEALMKSRFQMSSMGELTFFLGLQVKQKEDGIFISQDKYVAEILKKFDFANVKTASTPIETQKPLVKDEEANDVDVYLYRSMIGSLMYLTASRPDIMFAVCTCSRFQVTPKSSHLSAVKRIFRYLKGKPKLGLWYPRVSSFDLESYSDSDYAGANLDRKSTTGGCQFLGRRLISWQCKKQTIVATSTTEAEYVAAASCCGQVLWIQNQMLDYGFNFMNTKIYIDNESTICIVKNPVYHSKTKHIAIRHHFIRDAYEKKLIQVLKIHTDDNVADLLTKAFDVSRSYISGGLNKFRELLSRVTNGTEALLLPTLFFLWLDKVSTASAKLVPLGKVCTALEVLKKNTDEALISTFTTLSISSKMAVLDSCPKHNMVAYLEKSKGNEEFHDIIDFLKRSYIHFALTSKTINNVRHITAKVAGKSVSISEASIRSDLRFDDADGIDTLPNQAIFNAIQQMGHLDAKKKFVMYPRFISIFLGKQLVDVSVPLDHFPVNTLTSKVFSFMVKKGKHFSGKVTPLFASMLVQPTQDEGASSERPSEALPTPSPAPTSKVPYKSQTDSFPAQTSEKLLVITLEVIHPVINPFAKGESSVQRDPLLDEMPEDKIDHMEIENAQSEGRIREMVDEDKEIDEARLSTEDEVSIVKEGVSDEEQVKGTDALKEGTEEHNESTEEQREGTEEKVESTDGQVKDDETIAKVLLNMSKAKAVSREKEKGVELKDVEEIDRPKPTSTRSLLTLKPLPKIDPKDKGKKKIEEEDESEMGNYKHVELKIKKFEEVQALYEKIKRSDEDFIFIGSAKDERLIKRMNEKGFGLSKMKKKKWTMRFLHNIIILQRMEDRCLGSKPQSETAEHLEEINLNVVIRVLDRKDT